jgi:hypothetical protein
MELAPLFHFTPGGIRRFCKATKSCKMKDVRRAKTDAGLYQCPFFRDYQECLPWKRSTALPL